MNSNEREVFRKKLKLFLETIKLISWGFFCGISDFLNGSYLDSTDLIVLNAILCPEFETVSSTKINFPGAFSSFFFCVCHEVIVLDVSK